VREKRVPSGLTIAAASEIAAILVLCGCGGGSTTGNGGIGLTPAPAFTLSVSPGSVSVNAGGSGTATVTVRSQNGFSSGVSIAVTGLPTGVTIAPTSPISVTPAAGQSSQLAVTLNAAANATVGAATVTFTGTSGSLTRTGTVALAVAAVAPDFSLKLSESSVSIAQGDSSTMNVSADAIGGFTGNVRIAVSGLPTGMSTLPTSPLVIPAGSNSDLAFITTSTTATGSSSVTLTATATGTGGTTLTHTATITVNIVTATSFDYHILVTPSSGFAVGVGASNTAQVLITSSGPPPPLGISLSATTTTPGVTSVLGSTVAGPGSPLTLTVSADETAQVFAPVTVSIQGRTRSGLLRSATLTGMITIGGGRLKAVLDSNSSIPSGDADAINQALTYANGIAQQVWGSCTASRTTHVKYDPNSSSFFFQQEANGSGPVINMNGLPSTYNFFYIALAHELGNACVNGDTPAYTGNLLADITTEMTIDPKGELAGNLLLAQAAKDGELGGGIANQSLEASLVARQLLTLDPVTLAGIRTQPGYDVLFQEAGRGFYGILLGQTNVPDLVSYQEDLFAAENANAQYLSGTQFHTFLNKYSIDGGPAGDWMAATHGGSLLFAPPAASPGVKMGGFLLLPNSPGNIAAVVFTADANGGGTPVTTGNVDIKVFDNTGSATPLMTTSTDLSTMTPSNPFALNLSSLGTGAYNVNVSTTVSGSTVSENIVGLVIPGANAGSISQNNFGPFYVIAVPVDANGKATQGTLTAGADATVVYTPRDNSYLVLKQASGSTTGVVTVESPDSKKHTYTASPLGSQVVYVPVS
jgi:hypothetical protein